MNTNLPPPPDAADLDPDLTQIFDAARGPMTADPFVNSVLLRMEASRRTRLFHQTAVLSIALISAAFLAPYVAQGSLLVAGWLTERLPVTGTALFTPIGSLCAAFIAWRIARRTRIG
jgi:hypothetical protein